MQVADIGHIFHALVFICVVNGSFDRDIRQFTTRFIPSPTTHVGTTVV